VIRADDGPKSRIDIYRGEANGGEDRGGHRGGAPPYEWNVTAILITGDHILSPCP
jgi:hypothetical protein